LNKINLELELSGCVALLWIIRVLGAELGDENWIDSERSVWSVSCENTISEECTNGASSNLGNDSSEERGKVIKPVSFLDLTILIFFFLVHITEPYSKTNSWVEVS